MWRIGGILLLLLVPSWAQEQTVWTARPLSGSVPRIDGSGTDEAWQGIEPGVLATREQIHPNYREQWSGPADLSARVRAAYTRSDLYLLIEVEDDTIIHEAGRAFWVGDSIELFLDSDRVADPDEKHYSDDDRQIFLMPFNEGVRWSHQHRPVLGTTTHSRRTDRATVGQRRRCIQATDKESHCYGRRKDTGTGSTACHGGTERAAVRQTGAGVHGADEDTHRESGAVTRDTGRDITTIAQRASACHRPDKENAARECAGRCRGTRGNVATVGQCAAHARVAVEISEQDSSSQRTRSSRRSRREGAAVGQCTG